MASNRSKNIHLENLPVGVKIKLSALWASVMFCYVYGDFFSLFVPDRIQKLIDGHSGVGTTTPYSLLAFAMLMTIPSLMIFLSLVLKPSINRSANIGIGSLFTLIMILILFTTTSKWMIFYSYLALIEIILTSLIICYAWKWPKQTTTN
ncbi:DUF6326 family protein [Pedobacter foliorum]|uniref:DUF6326 family protein n=1 Tax=Pedobacter foliorum TaxID=2739058 RepID=UPI0015646AEF|nr:DUF6326 family protein [Pedobacter foliorum]NRF38057.1 hypothetical protein [Pedobacter foliorum]